MPSVSFTETQLQSEIAHAAETALSEHIFPGCVVGYVTRNGTRHVAAFGRFTYAADAPPVQPDSVFDTASITKSVPTGALALQFAEEGVWSLDDRLIEYLPELSNAYRERVTIRHLLTYTLGASGRIDYRHKNGAEVRQSFLEREFNARPGEVFQYSNVPAALLGMAITRAAGISLPDLAQERFFTPLDMSHTTFSPERLPIETIVPTEIDHWRGEVRGVVHDESAYACRRDGEILGLAGLFSTADDLLSFMEMLLRGGERGGTRYFSEETVASMAENQISDLGDSVGLGWELNQSRFMGKYCSEHTFGKSGFTGTLVIGDRERGIAYVILTNRIYPKRPPDSSAIHTFRRTIGDLLLAPVPERAVSPLNKISAFVK